MEHAFLVVGAEFAGFEVEQVVRLRDGVVLFLIGRQVVNLVGHLAVHHAAVRRLDEAVGGSRGHRWQATR